MREFSKKTIESLIMDFESASIEEVERQMQHQLRLFYRDDANVESDTVVEELYNTLLDEIILGVIFEVHRSAKIGLINAEDGPHTHDSNHFELVESPDVDIFGQQPIKKPHECVCPSCKRNLGAMKFAPHLEKCMGMGRNSSRIASRRIANNSKENSAYSGMMSDDDDDADWTAGSDRRRKKKDRNGTRRPKNQKGSRNGDAALEGGTNSDISNGNMNYDSMTYEEKKNLLVQICGVISEHTRRLCTRSMRCPQHTDEQRRAVRAALLNPQISEVIVGPDTVQVDVDTYEEGDGQSMRESLGRSWEQEHSNTSSPADSASTSSSSSKKREKTSKPKSKSSSKNHKGSPNFASNNNNNNSYNSSSNNTSVQD
ncbi:ataxin-7-like protein 3 [Anabrus simplex]|uniref:ataxin-7-like protein 3 n=1 Tax=Anabrus simplex TaxID=316456 RepID=UPI0034DD19E6